MFTNNMIYRFYAYNAYYYMFNDQDLVNEGVLAGVNSTMQATIYSDPVYGMDSVTKLANWFIAAEEGSNSTTYADIRDKFTLTDAEMTKIIGNNSMIGQISNEISLTILTDKNLNLRGEFDFTLLTQTQWAQGSILSNANFTF